jgi:hypothetical protein
MANLMPFLIMTALEAARLNAATTGEENRLDPRKVDFGAHAGKYVLPEAVKLDPAFIDQRDAFAVMDTVALDIETVFLNEA